MLEELARVSGHVVVVDAEEHDALSAVLPRCLLEQLRLALARHAPRGPEVEHDRLPAKRSEIEGPGRVDPLQRERRCRPTDLRRLRLMREAPDQQAQQSGDRRECDDLAGELHRPHQPATMNTGVPTTTCWNNHSACGMCMRMQPCDSE